MSLLALGAPFRSWQILNSGGKVSVADFGAVGDGVTDDRAAIQACIDANPGRRIYFPRPIGLHYRVVGGLTITSNGTWLEADSPTTSITIEPSGVAEAPGILFQPASSPQSTFIYNCGIRNIWIRKAALDTTGVGVQAISASNFWIENCWLTNHLIGFDLVNCWNTVVAKCFASGAFLATSLLSGSRIGRVRPLVVGGSRYPGSGVFLSDNNFGGPTSNRLETGIEIVSVDGLYWNNTYIGGCNREHVLLKGQDNADKLANIHVTDSFFDGYVTVAGAVGIRVAFNASAPNVSPNNLRFVGCNFDGLTTYGVVLGTGAIATTVISGCDFGNIGGPGVLVTGVQQAVITGNMFRGVSSTGLGSISVSGPGLINALTISGNTFAGVRANSFGIEFTTSPTSAAVAISGNSFSNAAGYAPISGLSNAGSKRAIIGNAWTGGIVPTLIDQMPTSASGLAAGQWYNDAGNLKIT